MPFNLGMFQKITSLTAIYLLTAIVSFAQQAKIKGVVKDGRGRNMDLVTVAVEGTATGTRTGNDGSYELDVPANTDLIVVYTFLGYDTEKKPLNLKEGEARTIDISLKKNATTQE